jgi:hypothetical protein
MVSKKPRLNCLRVKKEIKGIQILGKVMKVKNKGKGGL